MSKQTQATIRSSPSGFALVDAGGAVIRDGFRTRALAAMWGTRQKLYTGTTPRRQKIAIPAELEDHRVLKRPVAATLVGEGYPRFLEESNAGLWGPVIRMGANTFGHRLGDLKARMAAREIKTASK